MPGPRYSLRRLLAAVAASAIACAFLALAADLQVRALSGMTLAILAVAAAAGLALRGRYRAFSLGFSATGGAYFAAWKAQPTELPTTKWLASSYNRVVGAPPALAPEEVAGFLDDLISFFAAGHLVLTMLLATLGGLITLSVMAAACWARRGSSPRQSESPVPDPAAAAS